MVGQCARAQVDIERGFTTGEFGDIVCLGDRSRDAVAAHSVGSTSNRDGLANSLAKAGLIWTGRSRSALNSVHAASSSKKCRRSASTSRACATVALTQKVV